MGAYEQRLADIETHVCDGLITRAEADRKIRELKAMSGYADGAKLKNQR